MRGQVGTAKKDKGIARMGAVIAAVGCTDKDVTIAVAINIGRRDATAKKA